jgi:hypothetical protein
VAELEAERDKLQEQGELLRDELGAAMMDG